MQAVVRKSINNATMQFEKLGYVANNLANYNTAAYKTSRFEQILREDGYIDGAIRTNALQGSIRISKNPYDIAIEGEGYIVIDGVKTKVSTGDTITIEKNTKHSVKSIKGDLVILEVQYGTECNEDDIVRITRNFDYIKLI